MEALNSLWPHASRALEVCRLKRHLSDNEGSVSMFRLAKGEELEGFSGRDDVEEIGGPDGLLEEVTPSNAGGTEVHEGWRTGRRVTLHEIEGRYFVEWNADEGSTSGWEEIYRGTSWEDFDAFVAEYFDLYSGSVAPSEEDFGLANGVGSDRFEISQATLVGSLDCCNLAFDDWGDLPVWRWVVGRDATVGRKGSWFVLRPGCDLVENLVLRHHVPLTLPAGRIRGGSERTLATAKKRHWARG